MLLVGWDLLVGSRRSEGSRQPNKDYILAFGMFGDCYDNVREKSENERMNSGERQGTGGVLRRTRAFLHTLAR